MQNSYKAFVVEESDGVFAGSVRHLSIGDLPEGEILVEVYYSSLNYKDALSASGNKGITRRYPHTPGIDAAGVVVSSSTPQWEPGDKVIVTGYDLGMNTPGGFGQMIRVPASWAVALPEGLTLKEAMIIGTAGFTAAISLQQLMKSVQPADGKIIVSGATGGVGSMALTLLSLSGFNTVAISGKTTEYNFLSSLGVSEIIDRSTFSLSDGKPLSSAVYAGGIDTVGGDILVNILKATQLGGVVTTCGSVSSTSLNMSVFPFILRAVSLVGISAQNYPQQLRQPLWNKLAGIWKSEKWHEMYHEIQLDELPDYISVILKGGLKGRVLVRLKD